MIIDVSKQYIETQYHLAVLDFRTAKNDTDKWAARKTMARLEAIAMQAYGYDYADQLHARELGGDVHGTEKDNRGD